MALLDETADSLKARQIRIEAWDKDPRNGKRIAFRCEIEGSRFWVSALKRIPKNERIGVMDRLAKKAADQGGMILIRLGNRNFPREALVFHPDAYLEHGERYTADSSRKQAGERWINLPVAWGCSLQDFVDGDAEPRVQPTKREQIEPDGGWF